MSKRGISPLIATVLIIGFTIALAAVVMTWGGDFVRSTTEETSKVAMKEIGALNDVKIEIKRVEVIGGFLKLSLVNNGERDVEGFVVKAYGSGGESGSGFTETGVASYGGGTIFVKMDEVPLNINKVELLPVVVFDGEEAVSNSGFMTKLINQGDNLLYIDFEDRVEDLSGNFESVDIITDTIGFADSIMGKAGTFDGTTSYAIINEEGGFIGHRYDEWSYSALVYVESGILDNNGGVIVSGDARATRLYPNTLAIEYHGYPMANLHFISDGSDESARHNFNVAGDGMWHYVVSVFNMEEKKIKLYFDGVLEGTKDFSDKTNPEIWSLKDICIGAARCYPDGITRARYFDGLIDEVMIIERELSEDEIQGMTEAYGLPEDIPAV